MAQLMSLPLTFSYFSKIQIGFTFLVPAYLCSPGKRAIKRVCVCVCALSMSLHYLVKTRDSLKNVLCLMINHRVVWLSRCDVLLYYKFIIQFACKRIFIIGEHLAKLRMTLWCLVSFTHSVHKSIMISSCIVRWKPSVLTFYDENEPNMRAGSVLSVLFLN